MEVTIKLLENAMSAAIESAGGAGKESRFLIDGFPRQMDQAVKFDESVRSPSLPRLRGGVGSWRAAEELMTSLCPR